VKVPWVVVIQEKGPLSVHTGRGPDACRTLALRSSFARLPNAGKPDKLALSETNRAEAIGEPRESHANGCVVVDGPTYNRVKETVKKNATFRPQKTPDASAGQSGE